MINDLKTLKTTNILCIDLKTTIAIATKSKADKHQNISPFDRCSKSGIYIVVHLNITQVAFCRFYKKYGSQLCSVHLLKYNHISHVSCDQLTN